MTGRGYVERQRVVNIRPCDLPPVVIHDDKLDRIARRTGPRHGRAHRIKRRERLGDRRVLGLKCGLPAFVSPQRLPGR